MYMFTVCTRIFINVRSNYSDFVNEKTNNKTIIINYLCVFFGALLGESFSCILCYNLKTSNDRDKRKSMIYNSR